MLRRPASRSSSLARSSSSLLSSSSTSSSSSVARRCLSTSPPLLLRGRVKPEREMFPKRERFHPLTQRQIEDNQITEELTAQAGTTWKERLTYGIRRQSDYFTKEAMRMDREEATKAVLEGLPPLTENDIDDFYVNLMASGNELSNLPALPSPNRTAASIEEQKQFILQHESKEQEIKRLQVEENIRKIQEGVQSRQQMLLAAHSVQPQRRSRVAEVQGRIGAGAEGEEEMEMEMIGVQEERRQERRFERRLEVNEQGEAVEQQERSTPFVKSSSASFKEDLRQPPSSSMGSVTATSSSHPSTLSSSSSSSTNEPSSTQSFEERYPHATRLSSSSYPPSPTTTTADATTEVIATDSTPTRFPLTPEPVKAPSSFASRRKSAPDPNPTNPTSSPSQRQLISPPPLLVTKSAPKSSNTSLSRSTPRNSSSSFLTKTSYPSTLTQIDLPPHLLPAGASFIPQPTPLLLSLEQSILAAEASRSSSSTDHYRSPDYLSLPPLDPLLHGPPSPIQPHESYIKGPVLSKLTATTFPGEVSASSSSSLSTSTNPTDPSLVRLPRPDYMDVQKRRRALGEDIPPAVVPMGLLTSGEWKSIVYKTLAEPGRLAEERRLHWKRKMARGSKADRRMLKEQEQEEKKMEMMRKDREENVKRKGLLPRRRKKEVAAWLEKAGYALMAAKGLELMVRSGAKPELPWFLDILKVLSDAGDVQGVQLVITQSEQAGFPANYATYSHLVLAHLSANNVHSAISTLHNLESRSLYPLEPTYRALIQPLVNSHIDAHRATGWDLFAHMRLVAHPIPSKETYDMIIESCSNVILPEPERALDLWTEMTIDNKIPPDVHSFNAIIHAVGAVKKFYLESFKLMRQMLDFYHTSVPDSAQRAMYTPNRATFENLLVGAKKNGDIARTRWILTEMIRFSNHPGMRNNGEDISPTARTMVSIFNAYAASKPNIAKGDLNFVKEKEKERLLQVEEGEKAAVSSSANEGAVEVIGEQEEEGEIQEMIVEEEGGVAWEDGGEEEGFTGEEDWTVIDSETMQDTLDLGRMPSEADAAETEAWDSFDASDYTPPPPEQLSDDEQPSTATFSSSSSASSSDDPTITDIPGPEPTPLRRQEGTVQTSPIPQSSNEILHEARRLLSHARDDAEIFLSNPSQRTPSGNLPSLRHVLINTHVVNAFLCVVYRQSDVLADKVAAFETVYKDYGVEKDARSYSDFFDMLNNPGKRRERENAAKECFRIWTEWEAFEKKTTELLAKVKEEQGSDVEYTVRKKWALEPRIVEHIWTTSISTMTLAGQLSIALSMLKRFAFLYPPSAILDAILPRLPSQALVKLFPRSSHRPDPLPPHILFQDISDLHQSFALLQQEKPLAYIKWLTSEYARAIHQHRERKLSDDSPEGIKRAKERILDQELKDISREVWEKKNAGAEDREAPGRSGKRSLGDFERGGGFGRKPKDLKMGKIEAKIFRVWGQDVLDRYMRAKRQF